MQKQRTTSEETVWTKVVKEEELEMRRYQITNQSFLSRRKRSYIFFLGQAMAKSLA